MNFNVHSKQANQSMVLSHAVLIYTENHRNYSKRKAAYASYHEVQVGENNTPQIMPGSALTKAQLRKTLLQLSGEKAMVKANQIDWKPPRLIASTPQGLRCWWTPARSRWMHFKSSGLHMSLPTMQPPCLWVANRGDVWVYALDQNTPPTPESPVFRAPYFNVYNDGSVCTGSMKIDKNMSIDEIEDAFFASVFTHPNGNPKTLIRSRSNPEKFWEARLKKGNKQAFPIKSLYPTGRSVQDILLMIQKKEDAT